MVPNRKHAPEAVPGEPEAPVSAPQASPGPGAPDGAPDTPDNQIVPEPEPAPDDAQSEPGTVEAGPDQTPEDVIEDDREQIAARAKQADQYLELAQRTKADFENYRKRATRDVAAAQERGIAKLARELLPAVDNLDKALEAAVAGQVSEDAEATAQDGAHALLSGIKIVHSDL